jgi:hypothetical protein
MLTRLVVALERIAEELGHQNEHLRIQTAMNIDMFRDARAVNARIMAVHEEAAAKAMNTHHEVVAWHARFEDWKREVEQRIDARLEIHPASARH